MVNRAWRNGTTYRKARVILAVGSHRDALAAAQGLRTNITHNRNKAGIVE